ncbi:two-component sensor histidine kinase [Lewinella marina]|uniref:sensor histidine kinase n=1 Tax=Neolewinella marina TaxID=438751 RepID=UPI0014321AD9|nr:sensor histidine kinase [Neolewinella marina]NJB85085.1 two-component sensor histidine kinase [Neolewinella marina]
MPLPGGTPRMYEQYDRAMSLIEASLTDSAAVILTNLKNCLEERSDAHSPFALHVRLQLARSLERDRYYTEAAAELLALADDSRNAGLPEVEAQAYLEMALIHEQQSHPVKCRNYLLRAERLVRDNQLRPVMAYLFIRLSSYHRLFGSRQSAERYSRLALNHALDQDQPLHMATAHLLLSLIYRDTNPSASEYHLRHSSRIYRQLDSDINHMIVMLNLSNLHLERGDFASALMSNDSAFYYSVLAQQRGSKAEDYHASLLRQRSGILKASGALDSALHYLDQSRIAEVGLIERLSAERVAEVEARFSNAKREQQLQQQAQLLEFKKKREQWLMWLMLLTVVSLGVVAINYVRLRRANAALARQSRVIHSQNDELAGALREQQLLRGEIHHRVKNNLQLIISLLELQIEDIADPAVRSSLQSMEGRVYSMAAIHEILYREGKLETINFHRYVEKITDHFSTIARIESAFRFTLQIPDWEFNLDTAIPLGTILNELLTNSFKYGADQHEALHINIHLGREGDHYLLTYCDNGPGFPAGQLMEREGGLGSYLVNGMARQLRGRVETYNRDGACTLVYFNGKNSPGHDSGTVDEAVATATTLAREPVST